MVYLLFYSLVRMGFARSFYCSHVRCRLVVLSPRINVGLRLVIGLNLGGDGPFLRVNVCFSYRARGVILVLPISFFGIDVLRMILMVVYFVSFSLFSFEGKIWLVLGPLRGPRPG